MSQQRSLEQERASYAWDCISKVDSNHKQKYCQAVRGSMADIQINGLGQALAFWSAKERKPSEAHYKTLNDHVSTWVMKRIKPSETQPLLEWITKDANIQEYRRATSEAMAFLSWLSRFAEAELKD